MEYLSGQLILNERVDVRAMMLHGVIAKDRGTSVLKLITLDLLKHIWGFLDEKKFWPKIDELYHQLMVAAELPSGQWIGEQLSTNTLTNLLLMKRLRSDMSTEVPAIRFRELLERAE